MDIVPHCLISEKFASSCKFVPHLLLKYNCSQSAEEVVNLLVCLAVLQLEHAAWSPSTGSGQGEITKVGVAKNEV